MSQLGQNVIVAYKVQSTAGTAPDATGGKRVRLNQSPGLSMTRALIESNEIRGDMLTAMARLGHRSVGGGYNGDLSIGSWDDWLEAAVRATWVAAVAITESTMTSITTTTSTIVAAAGSWITEGVRVGDLVRLTGHATTANNDLTLRVTAVTASTITVSGTPLTADAVADTAFTLTILKKLANAATPTRRAFYIDEYNQDIDVSEVYDWCRISGFTLRMTPDGMATIDWRIVGRGQAPRATGASPYYTSPTLARTIGLVASDATIRLNGAEVATFTSLELVYDLNATTLPVIGSSNTPDVFDNKAQMSGNLSMLRDDLANVTSFDAETEMELHVLLQEPDAADPISSFGLFLPRIKLTSVEAPLGSPGAMVENVGLIVGKKESVTGYDDTMLTICTET